jgi:iron-sulfur cluster assembly accessory protein
MTVKKYDPESPKIVKLTDAAIGHFNNVAKGKYVKFGIMGGGCAGFQYHWELYDEPQDHMEKDEQTDYGEFILSVDSYSIMYLIGTTVDYTTDITGSKIDIQNPQAQAGCGCGESVNFNV